MGNITLYGGLLWDGTTFIQNEVYEMQLENRFQKEIHLAPEDIILAGLYDTNVMLFELDGKKEEMMYWEAMLALGYLGCVDGGTYGYQTWKRADRIWQWTPLETRSWINIVPGAGVCNPEPRTIAKEIQQERLLATFQESYGRALGFKVCLGDFTEQEDREWLTLAREVASQCHCPLLVQTAEGVLPIEEVCAYLVAGDILSGIYHAYPTTSIMDCHHSIKPEVMAAVQRGVKTETAAGDRYFDFNVYAAAQQAGLEADYISTGLTMKLWKSKYVYDLAHLAAMFVQLGVQKERVFKKITMDAANLMGIVPNLDKNLVVLKAKKGCHTFLGNIYSWKQDNLLSGNMVYQTTLVVKDHKMAYCYDVGEEASL